MCIRDRFGIGSISTYEHIEGKPEMIKDHLVWSIEEDSLLLSMVFAKELDPNYEWLRFDESVPEALKEEVNQSLLSYLNSFQTLLDDENYQYLIQTKDGKQLKSDAFDVSNALVHGIYEFNEKGYVLSDGDFSGYQLTSNTHLLDELSFVQESDMISNIENLVTIQLPKNMTMEIVVPNQLDVYKRQLLDMRSDGEITKEEFLNKKEEIDKKISQLTAEYEKDDCPTESDEARCV